MSNQWVTKEANDRMRAYDKGLLVRAIKGNLKEMRRVTGKRYSSTTGLHAERMAANKLEY